ncbi:glutamate racemase [Segetibacter aerophilus]|uniref:Glutamate racemase n=1 Tax=Segetibacter aerophilus TaxID=670293 RepID=A0A512BEW5_9BACT|nr:glutamate racemase [Segetibacter aerophilus]GEO10513.1 glutamate racemase [Segetibacter aerophilus]
MIESGPIGVFDSGYGGLTVLKEIKRLLPQYDYLYLGDNARAPYGPRSFETVYQYTLQAVRWFFKQGCSLVILACNTASAKALRTIQQNDLPLLAPERRVLGVIRPTTEHIGELTKSGKVGILGTNGTVKSQSYQIEINKFYPQIEVYQEACPMWVPLIENNEYENEGADFFIKKNLKNVMEQGGAIDTILLACTHYPIIKNRIEKFLPAEVHVISQGNIVAESLTDYLTRHPDIEEKCRKNGSTLFYTTDTTYDFDVNGSKFYGQFIQSKHANLEE